MQPDTAVYFGGLALAVVMLLCTLSLVGPPSILMGGF